ncbi:MAG: 6-pyruvoyl tetrahydropterin synthase [Ignavibacteria bacterium RIFOXYB2_FULL_35_12]|nr:MAG: 6-pyruvoyl tetrahydropterin synthase [Ignavibacteria bacterium RIFOXYA12_FULL_35_25]OGU91036.1 MAG: 6-pyruvoyl tetrahydropterin synthase [Ignavibacteria bacterium RIFOXYC12_FULL_35_11]OGU97130.1 MAG: 6-pyruvoyl tetrahydropterin synthase [Ignavibacteria bacterium RIFOXYB12_FULL_35_14]OGV02525.1 MAG: 6-pyruvoyl tetrahydropterin synthase [Ignavibacteria bacterium RIFOXYB2_FULL_35_12]OGV33151.1 MAG: 6-pyruvoyl tetrahydropterin synthase [Ignavibacteria bacterium RIFOXYD12_FULL_36_8]
MKVAKEFKWEMGHRLPEHFGNCKNIHGHSYKMIVEFEGELNKNEMIIDFYDVDKIIKPLLEKFDHAFMVNKNDKEVLEFLDKIKSKKVVVDFNSTVENICNFILNEIIRVELPKNISSVTVRIYETNEDYAEEKILLRLRLGFMRLTRIMLRKKSYFVDSS